MAGAPLGHCWLTAVTAVTVVIAVGALVAVIGGIEGNPPQLSMGETVLIYYYSV
jgi:hypothetical protein